MGRSELAAVLVLTLISLALGFGVYSVFFHPLTAEVRARFKGGRKRATQWLKTKRVVLAAAFVAIGILLISLGIRHARSVVQGRPAGPSSPPVEEVAPAADNSSPALEAPEAAPGAAPEAAPQAAPEAPVSGGPARQPSAAAAEPPSTPPAEPPAGAVQEQQ